MCAAGCRWPVIIAYPSFGSGIQYNGPVIASNMIAFLNKLLHPVKRVINETGFVFEEVTKFDILQIFAFQSNFLSLRLT